jgi:hypothetical protein
VREQHAEEIHKLKKEEKGIGGRKLHNMELALELCHMEFCYSYFQLFLLR